MLRHTRVFAILSSALSLLFAYLTLPAVAGEDEYKRASEAHRRYMERAHPTPEYEYATKALIPTMRAEFSTFLIEPRFSFFYDVNTQDRENDQLPTQNESSIAVNPTNPLNLIASAVDYRANSSTWVYYSFDGGKTWTNVNLGKPTTMQTSSNDPSVAFANDGTAYLCYGGFGNRSIANPTNGVFFARSTDGGRNWTAHIPVIQHTARQSPDSAFEDKYYIWSDNSTSSPFQNSLYIPWKRVINRDSSTQIVITHSRDRGNTWTEPIPVGPRTPGNSEDTTFGQSFPLAITGPSGEVYVVWNYGPRRSIAFNSSTDGGVSFGQWRFIQQYRSLGKAKNLNGTMLHSVKDTVRAESYPSMVCDLTNGPRRGWLYLVWAADSIPNIYFSRSTDKGLTWSTPKIIQSDETNDQFWPWIAIDPKNGDLGVMYLDSRDDPANIITNCYVSYSNDGGDTWVDRRASEANSDLRNNPFRQVFAGDYSGCAFFDGIIYPSWVDMRNTTRNNPVDNDVYTAIVNTRLPAPPDPFQAKTIPAQASSVQLEWVPPTRRVFGQNLDPAQVTLELRRDTSVIARLPGTASSYLDEGLERYRLYRYDIRAIAGPDTSVRRVDSAFAGGSRQIARPTISQASFGIEGRARVSVLIPSTRLDGVTRWVNPGALIIFRDSVQIREIPLGGEEVGIELTFEDEVPIPGWYNYSVQVRDSDSPANLSPMSATRTCYVGEPVTSFSDNLDQAPVFRYYRGGGWVVTNQFAFSPPNSLTESEGRIYGNRQRDTLLLPVVRQDGFVDLEFRHAALIHNSDTAYVEYSRNGTDWTVAARFNNSDYAPWADGSRDAQDWKPERISILAGPGALRIRLRFWSGIAFQDEGWFVDDIRISRDPSSVREQGQGALMVYPNPARDFVRVQSGHKLDDGTVRLTSVDGRRIDVLRSDHGSDVVELNLRGLEPGMYLLYIDGVHSPQKLVVVP